MPDSSGENNPVRAPRFLYGTAWKEDRTQRLTEMALHAGFRGIDTANQRRHYDEAAVGQAVRSAIEAGKTSRDALFVQTKFTFQAGQDHRLPYDPHAPIPLQVEQSFASSLSHFGFDRIDSYLLHGPSRRVGLAPDDWAAWRAMETIHDGGLTGSLGISNVTLEQLDQLCQGARVRPSFVQNRCYAVLGWDRDIRKYCADQRIVYQAFSLLTANGPALARPTMSALAQRYNRTIAQIVFRFAIDIGMLPLTGTTDAEHMREDLDVLDFHLTPEEVELIERIATS